MFPWAGSVGFTILLLYRSSSAWPELVICSNSVGNMVLAVGAENRLGLPRERRDHHGRELIRRRHRSPDGGFPAIGDRSMPDRFNLPGLN